MADAKQKEEKVPEPRGFGEHARGLSGEYAHEQGWGLNEAERTALPKTRQPTYGGKDYDYGARDFGDEPTDMSEGKDPDADKLEKDLEQSLGSSTQGGGDRATSDSESDMEKE